MAAKAEVFPMRERASQVRVPLNISEQSCINGYVFSAKVLKMARVREIKVPKSVAEGRKAFQYSALAARLATDGTGGGPTVGENSIKIWIDGTHPNAGSNADYIWMYFGSSKRIKLWGIDRTRFPKGWWLIWDLNSISSYLKTIPTDAWDSITLVTDSGDGILINRILIKHSSVTILDWTCNEWLDGSKLEKHGRLGLSAKILSKKLSRVGNRWTPQIHWAARELGKSNGKKYGTSGAWCSEFASWCLRKALWKTPTGSIGSSKMEKYFADRGRKYTKAQVLAKKYTLTEGDYVRFQWSGGGQHSALFIRYLDDPNNPTNNTRFQTIEGNASSTVKVATRKFHDMLSVGNTR